MPSVLLAVCESFPLRRLVQRVAPRNRLGTVEPLGPIVPVRMAVAANQARTARAVRHAPTKFS